MPRNGTPWTDEEDAMLGTMSDEALSLAMDRSRHSIKSRRVRLGIPPKHPVGYKLRETVMKQIELGERKVFGHQVWHPEHVRLLGTMSDNALAKILKKTPDAVKHARRVRGITAFSTLTPPDSRALIQATRPACL